MSILIIFLIASEARFAFTRSSPAVERRAAIEFLVRHAMVPARSTAKGRRRRMIRQSKANAVWRGGLKDGKGNVSVDSGVLSNTAYTFAQRFEAAKGTNPEELIAAAHAGCFSMALSAELGKANLVPESIETKATLDFDMKDGKPTVTKIHLDCAAKVPNASAEAFNKAAQDAKAGCPISRLLNTEITLNARLA
jgi:osmotically inducible protein OsmC